MLSRREADEPIRQLRGKQKRRLDLKNTRWLWLKSRIFDSASGGRPLHFPLSYLPPKSAAPVHWTMKRTDTLAVPVMLENADFHYAVQSGNFVWPWNSNSGLLVIRGAAGGGGGGGGSLLVDGRNATPADGGHEGLGGEGTSVSHGARAWSASGGDGGSGGGMRRNEGSEVPVIAEDGRGCDHGDGGAGGAGGRTDQSKALPVRHFVGEGSERTVFLASNGGNGGKGFPGKTRVVQLNKLSKGDSFDVTVGRGGRGGDGGDGFQQGSSV